mmetsp:Transcript_63691/g.87536  ORF Transcript_63691/g.87536 Transcript_63691/m.87536 type:complete len:111 (-) Transcript_63691:345-677(-)
MATSGLHSVVLEERRSRQLQEQQPYLNQNVYLGQGTGKLKGMGVSFAEGGAVKTTPGGSKAKEATPLNREDKGRHCTWPIKTPALHDDRSTGGFRTRAADIFLQSGTRHG